MANSLDIEQTGALLQYLRETGRVDAAESPLCTTLKGGVSNRTVLVERTNGPAWVIKQALPKLRVAEDWFSDPGRIHREALGLIWLDRLAPPGTIPPFVFEDRRRHLLAMQAVPPPHENWKSLLLAGGIERAHVLQFGQLLGTVHCRAQEHQAEIASVFADRTFFETLRLEPYYRFCAARHPDATDFLAALIDETLATRLTLVHGDFSPKNILVHQDRLVLLDHEVIHFGDPAFDLGFSLTHLLSKAHHLPTYQAAFLQAAHDYWETYRQASGEIARLPGLEARAARHTLACLLARVDGRSPLEYLSGAERNRQRAIVLSLIAHPPVLLPELFRAFEMKLRE
ncbi:MAG: phosphotransferase [Chloroflexi bacterium]|nr:phosphotransferase [Chloroflexota bacterium]